MTMFLIILMTAFFTTYLGFDIMDWPVWGPLAAVLGMVIKSGIEHTCNSAERGHLRDLRNCLMGIDNTEDQDDDDRRNDAISGQDGHELDDMYNRRSENA